jgi:hypothetical protein
MHNNINIGSNSTVRNNIFIQGCDIATSTAIKAAIGPPPPLEQLIPINRYLVDRPKLTSAIEAVFRKTTNKADPLVVLWGPGGVGKTTVAFEYARIFLSSKKNICRLRIRAESIDTLNGDFGVVADHLGINVNGKSLEESARIVSIELVRRYADGGVVVFDNAPSYNDAFVVVKTEKAGPSLQRLWPKGALWKKIVTTRNRTGWPPHTHVSMSQAMKTGEAVQLFANVSGIGKHLMRTTKAESLLNALAYHPLAICQAASVFRASGDLDFDKFADNFLLEVCSEAVLKAEVELSDLTFDKETPLEQRALLTTFNLNLKFLADRNAAFPRSLEFTAYMDADCISQVHFYSIAAQHDTVMSNHITQQQFHDAVEQSSLLQFGVDSSNAHDPTSVSQWLSIHRAIQLVLRFRLRQQQPADVNVLETLLTYFAKHFLNDRSAYINYSFLLRGIDQQLPFFRVITPSNPVVLRGLVAVAEQYLRCSEPAAALDFLQRILRHQEALKEVRSRAEELVLTAFEALAWRKVDSEWMANLIERLSTSVYKKAQAQLMCLLQKQYDLQLVEWKLSDLSDAEEENHVISEFLPLADTLLCVKKIIQKREDVVDMVARCWNLLDRNVTYGNEKFNKYQSAHMQINSSVVSRGIGATLKQKAALEKLQNGMDSTKSSLNVLQPLLEEVEALCTRFAIDM